MKIRISIFIIAVINLLASCEAIEAEPSMNEDDWLNVNIVTGVRMNDLNGSPIGQVGNPNIKNDDFTIFPNPAQNVISLIGQNNVAEIFISPASKLDSFRNVNFDEELADIEYSVEEIVTPTTFRLSFDSVIQVVNLNISDFPTGYYRIFINENQGDEFQWENIYIDNENTYPALIDSLVADWN